LGPPPPQHSSSSPNRINIDELAEVIASGNHGLTVPMELHNPFDPTPETVVSEAPENPYGNGLLRAFDGEQGARPEPRRSGCRGSSVTIRVAALRAAPAASRLALLLPQAASVTVAVSPLY